MGDMFLPCVVAALMSAPVRFGLGQIQLRPPEPLPLGGYTARQGRVMDGPGDPLFARVLRLRQGDTQIAIVSLEMLTVPESLVQEVQKRVPEVRLFLAATHTHCAPDSQMLNSRMTFSIPGIATFRSTMLGAYADMIAQGIRNTKVSRTMSDLWADAATVPQNRPRRQGGVPSKTATLVGDGSVNLLAHYAAHATIYGPERNAPSGDWPGALAKSLNCPVLVGAIGDVSPAVKAGDPADRIRGFVEGLISSWQTRPKQPIRSDTMTYLQQPIELGEPSPHPDFAKDNGIPTALAKSLVKKFAPEKAQLTLIRLGDLTILGVPGEPTGALGTRLEDVARAQGFRETLVVSHCNGWVGYILEPADYGAGGYEAGLAFHGPNLADRVVHAADLAFRKLKQLKSRTCEGWPSLQQGL